MRPRDPLLMAMLLAVLFMAASCSTSPRDAASTSKPSCCATNFEPSAAFTDKSLYQLDSTWTNDLRQPMKLSALRGRVQVVAMFFASCQYACPVIVHDMKRIEAALPDPMRADTGFVLVTIDTERDTPDALRDYRTARKLPANRWTFLHGTPDDTLELAALLGVKYKKQANGQFAHSNLITVLNAEGEIVHQQIGLNQDIQQTVQAVERAVVAVQKLRADHE